MHTKNKKILKKGNNRYCWQFFDTLLKKTRTKSLIVPNRDKFSGPCGSINKKILRNGNVFGLILKTKNPQKEGEQLLLLPVFWYSADKSQKKSLILPNRDNFSGPCGSKIKKILRNGNDFGLIAIFRNDFVYDHY